MKHSFVSSHPGADEPAGTEIVPENGSITLGSSITSGSSIISGSSITSGSGVGAIIWVSDDTSPTMICPTIPCARWPGTVQM